MNCNLKTCTHASTHSVLPYYMLLVSAHLLWTVSACAFNAKSPSAPLPPPIEVDGQMADLITTEVPKLVTILCTKPPETAAEAVALFNKNGYKEEAMQLKGWCWVSSACILNVI